VINAADPVAAQVEEAARRGGMRVLFYRGEPGGRDEVPAGSRSGSWSVRVTSLDPRPEGLDLDLALDGEDARDAPSARAVRVHLPLLGRYNAANAAAAAAAARVLGVAPQTIVQGLESLRGVPGRLERVSAGQPFLVVVDYAHTPDALERALAAV